MNSKILDEYSAAIKQSAKVEEFINHKLATYKYPRLKVRGSSIELLMRDNPNRTSTNTGSENFIDDMMFSEERNTKIKDFVLEEIREQAKEDLEKTKLEFKRQVLENI